VLFKPSYNIPYFKDIFNIAGYPALVKEYGNVWTYENCPRANIFRQRQSQVRRIYLLRRCPLENPPRLKISFLIDSRCEVLAAIHAIQQFPA